MKPRKIAVVDFETEAIEDAPNYPPKPVGVSVRLPGRKARYYAFGHPCENNSTRAEARKVLRKVWAEYAILCHNAAFDLEVAHVHFKLPIPQWRNIHDSMLLLYLYDPSARTISLKPSVQALLEIEPKAQTELRDWILANVPEAKAKPKKWGAHISKAPGKLVGKYADDDVNFALQLFEALMLVIEHDKMQEAYDVERQLIPVVLEMERKGVRIDRARLEVDTALWVAEREKLGTRIFRRLKTEPFNIRSSKVLADKLEAAGKADPEEWILTDKGHRSTARAALEHQLSSRDKTLLKNLLRYSVLDHMLNNFCLPWLERMETHETDRLYPRFHSTRTDADRAIGTRSGRFSSSNPSFQQLNRRPEDDTLPFMRRYLLPDEGGVLLSRDYDQQELRILAHVIGGDLLEMYRETPDLDLHETVRGLMAGGGELSRSAVKQLNFSIIYGGGAPRVASVLDIEEDEARRLKRAHSVSVPGLKAKMDEIQRAAYAGESVRTHGNRIYRPKSGKEYVQLNRIIQGSAADHTKRAMLRIARSLRRIHPEARMLIQVHDEILVTAPEDVWKEVDAAFKRNMEFKYFDIPTPTTGKVGENWGEMRNVR